MIVDDWASRSVRDSKGRERGEWTTGRDQERECKERGLQTGFDRSNESNMALGRRRYSGGAEGRKSASASARTMERIFCNLEWMDRMKCSNLETQYY